MSNAKPRDDNPPPPPSQSTNVFPPHAQFIMFKSNVTKVSSEKSKPCYIGSGATLKFLNDKSQFDTHEEISPQSVKIAKGKSQIIGKGSVTLNLGINITMKAFFAP